MMLDNDWDTRGEGQSDKEKKKRGRVGSQRKRSNPEGQRQYGYSR